MNSGFHYLRRDDEDDGTRVFAAFDGATVADDDVRLASFDGDTHIVAPVVAVQEQILKGSFLPNSEIQRASAAFGGVPLPVNHPTSGDRYVSANSTDVLERQTVGRLFGDGGRKPPTMENSALTGEIWVNVDKSNRLAADDPERGLPAAILAQYLDADDAERVADVMSNQLQQMAANVAAFRANNGSASLLEVSTAYWYDEDPTPGTFDGDRYDSTQRNLKPDHLALLPNVEGECSVEDGCGAPRLPAANAADDGGPYFLTDTSDGDGDADTDGQVTTDGTDDTDDGCHVCTHSDGDTQRAMNFAQLSSKTGVPVGALQAMSETDLKTLAANHDIDLPDDFDGFDADGDGDGNGNGDGNDDTDGDDDDDVDVNASGDVADALDTLTDAVNGVQSNVSALSDRLDTLEANQVAQEFGGEDPHDVLKANTSMDDDTIDSFSEQQAAAMARELPSVQAQAHMAGRMGLNDFGGESDDDESAGAFAEVAAANMGQEADD